MPDQNSAASEHAIMQDITQPLAEVPDDPVAAVASVDFAVVLRGYDREAVDEYVHYTTQLIAELAATRSPEAAVRRALERVGERVTSILSGAHEIAEGITSQSRAEAEERLMRARAEAEERLMRARAEAEELERDAHSLAQQLKRDAEQKAREREQSAELRVQELDAEVDRIWAKRERIVSDVRNLSEELSELAGAAATRFPAPTTDESAVVASPESHEAFGPQTEVPASDEPDRFGEEHSKIAARVESVFGPGPESAVEGEPDFPAGADTDAEAEADTEAGAAPEIGPAVEPLAPPDVGTEAELRQISADLRDEPFAAAADEVSTKELAREPAVGAPAFAPNEGSAAEHPTAVLQRTRMRVIDLRHLGRERVIGCWQVDDVLIDPGPASCLDVLLKAVQKRPRAVLLTHIHLDHAGAAGSLVKRWPDLEVYVHERGASHLADPTRLLESARRLYGDDTDRLWGEVLAVPEANLRVLSGGERLFDGRFKVAYTPGHASDHVAYLHERTAFVGDLGGVRITPETLTIPPTPPPDIDLEAWQRSIDQVLRWKPDRLVMTHFGANDDVGGQLADLSERLDNWAVLVRTEDLQAFVALVEDEIERGASPTHREAYKQAAPPEQTYAGLQRYWSKRNGGASGSAAEDDTAEREDLSDAPRGSVAEASTHAEWSARASRWVPPAD